MCRCLGDLGYRFVEDGFVVLGRSGEPAYLAHELARRRFDLLGRCRGCSLPETFDGSAHAVSVSSPRQRADADQEWGRQRPTISPIPTTPEECSVPTEADFRLPRTVIPSHYAISLEPDLEAATFAGTVGVDVDVVEPVQEVMLNATEIDISKAALVDGDGNRLTASVVYDDDTERATLRLDGTAAPGKWRVEAEFTGILNDQLRGFYRSSYVDVEGNEKTIATTQFEAPDARRAFPCWDEPDLKATYDVTLVVEEGLMAVSNGAEISRVPAGDGKVEVTFATTMKISTYLVAFVVGELEATAAVDVDGTPLRIVFVPGKEDLTEFALEMGAHSLRFFVDYYGIPYPGDKLDMIAIPDFAWGAMENLGAITYREQALLLDRKKASQLELLRVADVIAHEIAHMWFGDLVTMKWWNGIWLNEAFATFAELKCVDAYRPDWHRWDRYAASRTHSMHIDALAATRPIEFPVASPEESTAMFDSLTYIKGSSVLRMLEQYLGEEAFRTGVSNYLKQHAYGNTETADLWVALEDASGQPVGEIMDGWIFQGGFPVVTVGTADGGYQIEQRQFRYLGQGDKRWKIPLRFRDADGDERFLLTEDAKLHAADGIVVNAGGDGFYRVAYTPDLLADLRTRLDTLRPAERYGVVSDTWASVLKGDTEADEFASLVGSMSGESDLDVWGAMLTGLTELDRVVSSDTRPNLQSFVRGLVGDKMDELGWQPDPGDSDRTRELRGLMIRAMGNLGSDKDTQQAAAQMWEQSQEGADYDAEVRDAALGVLAANGSMDEFDRFIEIHLTANDPQDVVKYLRAATAIPEKDAVERLFQMVIDGEIRRQDTMWVVALLVGHRENGPRAWSLLQDNWDAALASMPPQNARHIIDLIYFRSEPDVAADIEQWLADHPIEAAQQYAEQQIELMKVRVGLREREADRLSF